MQKFQSLWLFWKQSWLDVLRSPSLPQDGLSAVTVAAVALPLNIALAVACGLPPSAGLLAGAIGGAIAAIFGGAPLQVTGPAAALNIMVLSITKDFGAAGVAAACLIIGFVQIVLCSLAAGRFIRFVPEAVLAGFTTGVGLKLLDNQIPEFLGFNYTVFELATMLKRPSWLHEVSWLAVVCGLFVALLVTTFKPYKRFPAALVGIAIVTAVSVQLNWHLDRVGTIPALLPLPMIPSISDQQWLNLCLATLPLALLAAIESLLSAQAVDRMAQAKKPHHPDLELLGQGMANIGSGLMGGMPVSGVVVRSSVNVQCGARTRLSALLHAAILLCSILFLNETMATIPLSALAGLLCVIGMRLIEFHTLHHLWREHRVQALAFLLTAAGTVSGHLMLGLALGILVAWLGHWQSKKAHKDVQVRPVHPQGIRAVIKGPEKNQRRPGHYHLPAPSHHWLSQIRERAQLAASAFIHQKASVIGRVVLGEHVHIAAESSVRADEGSPFFIGSNSNIQDGVVIHALKEKWVHVAGEDWAVFIGEDVSVAHQALIHGPCYIGDHSFIGFQAVVHDSVVGSHCYVGIGAVVVGVEVEAGRYVPHGAVVDSQAKADQLPPVTDAHRHFNEDVVDVNKGLVSAYRRHHEQQGKIKRTPVAFAGTRAVADRF
ncbi:MAG TPA: SulP family inorganic anion transporter [Oligoflexus sp.]|uniref:SulP family inorganic anion transporter n=1 Tax=Oligoflexus sp. TaxID=1971216 RepID=UPI002D716309|nr:SulP family inorganic anion transporter [Oligoflexus sp.]HYX36039.1 SulP family inorganic anion transporter [Oligoflexus sp.]